MNNSTTFKDVAHLYIGCDVRIKGVLDIWSNWRSMTISDYILIVNHDVAAQIKLRHLDSMTQTEWFDLLKIYDHKITMHHLCVFAAREHLKKIEYDSSTCPISAATANAYKYLLSKHFDLYGLLDTEYAVSD